MMDGLVWLVVVMLGLLAVLAWRSTKSQMELEDEFLAEHDWLAPEDEEKDD